MQTLRTTVLWLTSPPQFPDSTATALLHLYIKDGMNAKWGQNHYFLRQQVGGYRVQWGKKWRTGAKEAAAKGVAWRRPIL